MSCGERGYGKVVMGVDFGVPANVDTPGYAACVSCTWKSKVFTGTRSSVFEQAKRAYKTHKPPWWMRWMM